MKLFYYEGVVVSLVVPFIAYFLGLIRLRPTLFLSLAFFGIWTIIAAILMASRGQRTYYLAWGMIIASLSTVFVIPAQYTIVLILVSIVVLVVFSISMRQRLKPAAIVPAAAPPSSVPVGPSRRVCSKCGAQVPEGASFCPACGTNVS